MRSLYCGGIAAVLAMALTRSWIIALPLVGIAAGIPFLWDQHCEERRRLLYADQLRQSLQGMVHSLRVGVGFLQAVDWAAREGAQPLAGEWMRLLQAVQMGTPLDEALAHLGRRIPVPEIHWFVTAVRITQETGGSLAGVLETLSATLQERQTLREKVAALTAQGKASGIILGVLPLVLMTVIDVIAPSLMAPLFSTRPGQEMIAGIIISLTLGGLLIRHIVQIKVD